MPITWHLLTGEYPPDCGGVGDYSAALAAALAEAGDEVHVWTPSRGECPPRERVTVHVLPDRFGAASREVLSRAWNQTPGVVLLQYVPNALGRKGANLPFCWWFARLRRRLPDLRVMFHEPYFYFRWSRPWAPTNALAVVQRLMARALLDGATRVYYSTETWRRFLHPADGTPVAVLAVPSTIPEALSVEGTERARHLATAGHPQDLLVGHFGTYGAHVAAELREILPRLAGEAPDVRMALLGDGGPAFARDLPAIADRIWAPGRLPASEIAAALRACDVLVQPYRDGITTRRTSAMAGLRSGVAMVTTRGDLTERVWAELNAARLVPARDHRGFVDATIGLLRNAPERAALGRSARDAYMSAFALERTVATLRATP